MSRIPKLPLPRLTVRMHGSDEVFAAIFNPANRLLQRDLFQIQLSLSPIKKSKIEKVRQEIHKNFGVLRNDANYLFAHGTVSNEAYVSGGHSINILMKNGKVLDMVEASDLPTIQAMSKIVKKNYLCWPKHLPLPDIQDNP